MLATLLHWVVAVLKVVCGTYTCHACPDSHAVATVGAMQVTVVCPSSLWHFSLSMPAERMNLKVPAGHLHMHMHLRQDTGMPGAGSKDAVA